MFGYVAVVISWPVSTSSPCPCSHLSMDFGRCVVDGAETSKVSKYGKMVCLLLYFFCEKVFISK